MTPLAFPTKPYPSDPYGIIPYPYDTTRPMTPLTYPTEPYPTEHGTIPYPYHTTRPYYTLGYPTTVIPKIPKMAALQDFYDHPTPKSGYTLQQVLLGQAKSSIDYDTMLGMVLDGLMKMGPVHFQQLLESTKMFHLLSDSDLTKLHRAASDLAQKQFTRAILSLFHQVCLIEMAPNNVVVVVNPTVTDDTDYDYVASLDSSDPPEVKETKTTVKNEDIAGTVSFLVSALDQLVKHDIVKVWNSNSSKCLRAIGETLRDCYLAHSLCIHPQMKIDISSKYYHTLCQDIHFTYSHVLDRKVISAVFIYLLQFHVKCVSEDEAIQLHTTFQQSILAREKIKADGIVARKREKEAEEEFLRLPESALTVGQRLALETQLQKIRTDADESRHQTCLMLHNKR